MDTDVQHSVTQRIEQIIAARLQNWPPQWEGFHWPGYTYEHTMRVRNLALTMAGTEGADPHVVGLAALLHDISKSVGKDHAHVGADEAARTLHAFKLPDDLVQRVHHVIYTHSGENTREHPVENRVLGDADLIDANFGLVAAWRFITIRAGRGGAVEETIAGMNEWLPKKDELMSLLRSDAGVAVARERSTAMHRFCTSLADAFALPEERNNGMKKMVAYIAAQYERASLSAQMPEIRRLAESGGGSDMLAACNRLEEEMAGTR
ncbi:MAG: HD domain-containing protein [Spirochaetes bacterium]|nr:HD domain-containing protein [Spirochaetota bacterium]